MKEIDHIGIAVHSIEKTLPFYVEILGFKYIKTELVEEQKVKVAFIDAGNCKIELLEPTHAKSTVQKFLDKRGEGIHHIALKTDDIHKDIQFLIDQDIHMIDQIPRRGAGGALVSFLHPKSTNGVLLELCKHHHS